MALTFCRHLRLHGSILLRLSQSDLQVQNHRFRAAKKSHGGLRKRTQDILEEKYTAKGQQTQRMSGKTRKG
jgi:hypothetical protein